MKNLIACCKALGINEDCSIEEVKRAYRLKAKKLYPDINGGDSKGFVEITNAYETLLKHLESVNEGTSKEPESKYTNVRERTQSYRDYSYFDEMGFNQSYFHQEMYEDVIQQPFPASSRGEDVYLDIDITPEEQSQYKNIGNINKKISYKKKAKCTSCKGLGYRTYICLHCSGNGFTNEVTYSSMYGRASTNTKCNVCIGKGYVGSNGDKCLHCKGLGYIEFLFETEVPIDLISVMERQQRTLCFEGLGHEVLDPNEWGFNGNLVINLNLIKSSSNTHNHKVYISFVQAIEGCDVIVELENGMFRPNVKIPAGIRSGTKLKIPKGNNQYLIEVLITVPKLEDMNRKATKLFNQLKETI